MENNHWPSHPSLAIKSRHVIVDENHTLFTTANTRIDQADFVLFQALLPFSGTFRLVGSTIGCTDDHGPLLLGSARDVETRAARTTADHLTHAFEEAAQISACSWTTTVLVHWKKKPTYSEESRSLADDVRFTHPRSVNVNVVLLHLSHWRPVANGWHAHSPVS